MYDMHDILCWRTGDIEHRFGFTGSRFTQTNLFFTLLLGASLAVIYYLILYPIRDRYLGSIFYDRGVVPYLIVLFTGWSIAILIVKASKLAQQRKALSCVLVPEDPAFVLSPATVEGVLHGVYAIADDPRKYVLLNRILIALSNLRNIGQIGDVDEILRSQAQTDEAAMQTSYSLLQGFIWAIPVLGFIGTVLGLSQAIGGFGSVLGSTSELSELKGSLQQVTAGLAVAFETTLQGLVAAMVIQLSMTMLKQAEEEFLDDCNDYGIRHIVSRLRLTALGEAKP